MPRSLTDMVGRGQSAGRLAAALAFLLAPTAVTGEEIGPGTRAALFAEARAAAPGETIALAVRLTMKPGWHTYWKNPGGSGMATRLRWTLPEGFEAGPVRWPVPQRIVTPDFTNYGYEGEATLLADLRVPPGAKGTARIGLRVDWVECADICVPGRAELSLALPVRAAAEPDPGSVYVFSAARARLPEPADGWTFRAEADGKTLRLSAAPPPGRAPAGSGAEFFPDPGPASRGLGRPRVRRAGDVWTLAFAPSRPADGPVGGLLVFDDGRAVEVPPAAPVRRAP